MRCRHVLFSFPGLLFVLLGTPDATAQKYRLPDSPIGRALTALLETIESGEAGDVTKFVEQHLDDRFKRALAMEEHVAMFQQIRSELHPFEIESVEKTGDFSAKVILSAAGGSR